MGVPVGYPLTPNQQGLLFHCLSEEGDRPYFIQDVFEVEEELDVDVLHRAWSLVVARHDVLRSAFKWERVASPLLVVYDEIDPPFAYLSWMDAPPEGQRARLGEFLEEDRRQGFDFREAPLHRLTVIEAGPSRWWVVLTISHAICDAYAQRVIEDELLTLYGALRSGSAPKLTPSRSFGEYAQWLQQRDKNDAVRYWRELLSGFSEPLRLGIDGVGERVTDAAERDGEEQLLLDPELVTALGNYGAEHGATVATVALFGFTVLVGRYGGDKDVVVGSISNARARAWPRTKEPVEAVGYYVNAFPVRLALDPETPVEKALAALKDQMMQVQVRGHDLLPVADIYRCSDVPRGEPVFEIIFNYRRSFPPPLRFSWRPIKVWQHSSYPFELSFIQGDNSTRLRAAFDKRRFDPELVKELLRHYATLLGSLVTKPARVSDLRLLKDEERVHFIDRDATAVEFDHESTIHEQFAAQARRTPSEVAVAARTKTLLYEELDRYTDKLAAHLRSLGLGPGDLVGICTGRDRNLLIGLLSILKAGCGYVPLDPGYPAAHLSVLIEDSRVPVVLARRRLENVIPKSRAKMVWVDDLERLPEAPPAERTVTSDGVAYTMFTSGSTGRPKGVMVTHRNVMNFFRGMDAIIQRDPPGRWLAVTSMCFDISVLELLWTLSRGFEVVVGPELSAQTHDSLAKLISSYGVTHLQCTPSLAGTLAAVTSPKSLKTLRQIFIGGEAFPLPLLEQFRRVLPRHAEIYNMYGPTETTVWSTVQRVGGDDREIPIGHPIANTYVYILDEARQPVPIGVPGEIFIGGAGVANGYLHRDDLTAERFVADPFTPDRRIYRTGDVGRRRKDGAIDFLGRADHQVKILGHRIEPGEIEATMMRLPGVKAAVVVARGPAGRKRLVGYYVPESAGAVAERALADFLKAQLPPYKVPALLAIDEMPLTANGKVDRKRLPEPVNGAAARGEEENVAPRDEVEQALADIWMRVMGLTEVSVRSNFFEIGGDSLMAVVILSWIRGALHVDLPVATLLQAPTIEDLAEFIRILKARRDAVYAGLGAATTSRDSAVASSLIRLQPVRAARRNTSYTEPFARGYRRVASVRAISK
jgi:amino acid adenylation domain-containing protein